MAAPVAIPPTTVVVELARPLALPLPPQLSTLAPGTQLLATVVGHDASGRALLRTDAGPITAARKLDVQRGTLLTLEVRDVGGQPILAIRTITPPPGAEGSRSVHNDSQPGQSGTQSSAGTPVLGSAGLPLPASPVSSPALIDGLALLRSWPALAAALQSLVVADPAFARALARRRLPTVGGDVSLAAARFAALLTARRGLGALLGREALEILGRSRSRDILGRLEQDFALLADVGAPVTPGEWRILAIPVVAPHGLGHVRLMVRTGEGGTEGGTDPETKVPSRFVIDVQLARLGPVQVDGLVGAARLDMTIRSMAELPAALAAEIERLFDKTLTEARLRGSLRFAIEPTFPVTPEAELGARQHGTWVA